LIRLADVEGLQLDSLT